LRRARQRPHRARIRGTSVASFASSALPARTEICATAAFPKISDYAVIGDSRTAALVSQAGAVEWLCLPSFSSPSVFAALLDRERGGTFSITTDAPCEASRRYVGDTNVLETTLATADGRVRITDFMPIPRERPQLEPMRQLVRIVEGVEGNVSLRIAVDPRPDYGRRVPLRARRAALGWTWSWGSELLNLSMDADLRPAADGTAIEGRVEVGPGTKRYFSLGYTKGDVGTVMPLGAAVEEQCRSTIRWWERWAQRCRYDGPHRAAVVRSALALKLMTYALSGGVVAAPTTSLPEAIGGARNWDYRYCWLRDAALTMRAFTRLGCMEEASAFFAWLMHTTRLTWPKLQVMYDVYGRTDLAEAELSHWEGYARSAPVRIGNAASEQLQLDTYGALLSAALEYVEGGGELGADERRLLAGFGRSVLEQWQCADSGMWEVRGEPRHYTMSKVWCWTALRALLELHERGLLEIRADAVRSGLRAIETAIESRGFSEALGSYVAAFDGDEVDAGLLLMPTLGYKSAGDARMRGTYDRIHERLSRNGLLYRYETRLDRMPAREGAFGICSFWVVDHLVCRGELAAAHGVFEHALSYANDVGLFAEEIDPDSGEQLGNFPQAFTHVGVIFSALSLADAERHRPAPSGSSSPSGAAERPRAAPSSPE
jgi:GH15 family glucan-1,4-alpha-glucosidase